MTRTIVENDIADQELVFTVIETRSFKTLVWPNVHTVRPGAESGLVRKQVSLGSFFEATAYLPHTQAGELHNKHGANDEKQP